MNVRPAIEDPPVAQARFDRAVNPVVLPEIVACVDLCALVLAAAAAMLLADDGGADMRRHAVHAAIVGVIYFMLTSMSGLHAQAVIAKPFSRADALMLALIKALLLLSGIQFGLGVWTWPDFAWLVSFGGLAAVCVIVGRIAAWRGLRALGARALIGRSAVVLGAGEQGRRLLRRLSESKPHFLSVVGVFESRPGEAGGQSAMEGYPIIGGLEELLTHVRAHSTDNVILAMPWHAEKEIASLVETLKELPVNIYLGTDLVGYELAFTPMMGDQMEIPLFEVIQRPISGWSAALKTAEDYVISSAILLLLLPLFVVIAIAIKLDSPGPVFFMQERLGFNNKSFRIFKFRSMYHSAAPETVVRQAQRGDPRVTRVGRFLRATSLDELPQLLNVLNGTMSLVGPRPHALSHNVEYGAMIRNYFARHRVKPGITGWAQVNGLRGETETIDKMEARIRHDIYYADNWSFLFDIRILVMTIILVPLQKTAY